MSTSYGKNTKLLEKLKDSFVLKIGFFISRTVEGLFTLIGAILMIKAGLSMMDSGQSGYEDEINPIVVTLLACLSILIIMFGQKKAKNKKSAGGSAHLYATFSSVSFLWGIYGLFIILNDVESDIDGVALAYIISFIVLEGLGLVCWYIETKKRGTVSSNIEKGYLELKPDMICGISFNSLEITGDGVYFELAYEDIKDARSDEANPDAGRYYNLYIDHKHGTYKLSIERAKTAQKTLRYILDSLADGQDPFEEIRKEEALEAERKSWHLSAEPLYVEKNSEGLISCPVCGKWQNADTAKCFNCGQKLTVL